MNLPPAQAQPRLARRAGSISPVPPRPKGVR
jgi:hypothetical protein